MNESNVLEKVKKKVTQQAITEGFIVDETIAIDATHFEARDQAPPKEEKPKAKPKKRGRKSKAEREQWLQEQRSEERRVGTQSRRGWGGARDTNEGCAG